MDAQYSGQFARQSLGGGREMDEEMQHVLQFLDTSQITPPSGSDLVTQQSPPQQPLQVVEEQPTPEQLREMAALQENEGREYNEIGEVIDLLGSLDANDTDPTLLQQQEAVFESNGGVGLNPTELPRAPATNEGVFQRVQLPRSTALASNHNGVDSISPMGLLNGPSMSPATINWLQTLIPSTSTESLTGLISPASLYSTGGGSATGMSGIGGIIGSTPSSGQADGASIKSGGLPRTPSCEIIDWKAYNESSADKTQKEPAKWRVIPQHGPHADPAGSSGGSIPTTSKLPPGGAAPPSTALGSELSGQQHMHLSARKAAEEKNKRKALVSPEYVQYANPASTTASAALQDPSVGIKMESDPVQYATKVPEPTGRRPFKKSLHQTTVPLETNLPQHQQQSGGPTTMVVATAEGKEESVRCKCTGKCRNARCACVKAGLVCGAQCKCVSCANPFVPMAREGIDIQLMVRDVCLMQYLSKIKDMQELLDSTVSYECCEGGGGVVQVKHTVENGFACPHCGAHFTYSWCNNRLCPEAKKPRRHCEKCRRCGDHRNQHCDLCNHCYFAGVANSFRCSCQSGGGGGSKTRAVVPNPVHRDSEAITKSGEEAGKQVASQLFGGVNPAGDGSVLNENSGANNGLRSGAEDEVDDSCKMQ